MGKAAISDEYMTPWMEYIYQQKPLPEDPVGVPVMITVVDSSGNAQNIGTAISDSSGNFGYSWIPTAEGLYKIIATFEGSESYGSSHNTAYLTVDPAPAAPQATSTPHPTIAPTTAPTTTPTPTASPSVVPEPEATPSADIYIIAAAAAVIIVVVAVAAVFLRKRK
jgi:hypothetical protein